MIYSAAARWRVSIEHAEHTVGILTAVENRGAGVGDGNINSVYPEPQFFPLIGRRARAGAAGAAAGLFHIKILCKCKLFSTVLNSHNQYNQASHIVFS